VGIDVSADEEICAGSHEGGKDSCFGDSGGPLVVKDPDVRQGYILIGVVGWGIQCGNPAFPGIYRRVATYYGWVHETMRQNP
jgi:secreted trypsin-like serine protease